MGLETFMRANQGNVFKETLVHKEHVNTDIAGIPHGDSVLYEEKNDNRRKHIYTVSLGESTVDIISNYPIHPTE